eukprot:gene12898-13024_t
MARQALPGLFGGLDVVISSGHVNAAIAQLSDLMQLQLQPDPGSIRCLASGVPRALGTWGIAAAALCDMSLLQSALQACTPPGAQQPDSSMQLQQLLPQGQPLSLDLSRGIIEAALSTEPAAAAWAVCVLQTLEAPQQLLHDLSLQHLLALAAFLAVPAAATAKQAASAVTGGSASLLLLVAAAACDMLIQQQRAPAWYGTSADAVLQLWQHAGGSSSLELLSSLSRQTQNLLLAALVRKERHKQAVDLAAALEQHWQQLTAAAGSSKDQAVADHYWSALEQLVQDCLAEPSTQVPAAVLAAYTAAAVKIGHSQAIQPQLVLRLAPLQDVLQAVMQLVQQREEAATALLINGLLASCTGDLVQPEQFIKETNHEQLGILMKYLCSSGSTIALAEQLLQLDGQQLLLELYHRTRQAPGAAKPSLEGLVLDLGLIAAGRAGDWHECGAVLSSARTVTYGGKGSSGSRRATSSMAERHEWLPLLSEAQAVLMAALVSVHQASTSSEALVGVLHAAQLWAEVVKQARTGQHRAAAADQRPVKGSASGKTKAQQDTAAGTSYLPLLSLPVLNSYLAACVDVVRQQQQQSALGVEEVAAAASTPAVELGKTGWPADDLQCVLASAAAVWRAVGRTGLVVPMLDGLTAAGVTTLDNPQLAAEVEAAVEADDDLMTNGLGGRLKNVEDVFEIPEIAKVGAGAGVPLGAAATPAAGAA